MPHLSSFLFRRAAVTAAVFTACVVASSSAAQSAQASPRVAIPADSMTRLTGALSEQSRALVDAYLAASDSAAPRALRAMLSDPALADVVLAVLPGERSVALRRSIVSNISFYERWSARPALVPVLRQVVSGDSSVAVVDAAVEALRVAALRQTGLRTVLAERITRARAAKDTAMLRLVLEEEESAAHLERNVVAPRFLRTPPPPFAAAPTGRTVRFVAFGDYGSAHLTSIPTHQAALAGAMRAYHKRNPFTFGLTTGDNFYPTSFPTPNDPAWTVSWESLYAGLEIPFYISLGNHDWGEPAGPMAEHIYGLTSRSWKLPALYYTYTAGDAQFFAINTNALTERQLSWLRDALGKSTAKWKIVYGHFPVYEQTSYTVDRQRERLLPLLKEFHVDMYLCGHHHSLQHWQVDGIDYVVTGAGGAPTYELGDTTKVAPGRKFAASRPGFADVQVEASSITLRFVGMDGGEAGTSGTAKGPKVLYEFTRRK